MKRTAAATAIIIIGAVIWVAIVLGFCDCAQAYTGVVHYDQIGKYSVTYRELDNGETDVTWIDTTTMQEYPADRIKLP